MNILKQKMNNVALNDTILRQERAIAASLQLLLHSAAAHYIYMCAYTNALFTLYSTKINVKKVSEWLRLLNFGENVQSSKPVTPPRAHKRTSMELLMRSCSSTQREQA